MTKPRRTNLSIEANISKGLLIGVYNIHYVIGTHVLQDSGVKFPARYQRTGTEPHLTYRVLCVPIQYLRRLHAASHVGLTLLYGPEGDDETFDRRT